MTELSSFKRDYTACKNLKDYLELLHESLLSSNYRRTKEIATTEFLKAMQSEGKVNPEFFTQRKYLSHIKMK